MTEPHLTDTPIEKVIRDLVEQHKRIDHNFVMPGPGQDVADLERATALIHGARTRLRRPAPQPEGCAQ